MQRACLHSWAGSSMGPAGQRPPSHQRWPYPAAAQLPTIPVCGGTGEHLQRCVLLPAAWTASLLVRLIESLPVLLGAAGKAREY